MAIEAQPEKILEIPLTERISAHQLGALLSVVAEFYAASQWLEQAELEVPSQPLPPVALSSDIAPLWIARLEIGTPNVLKLRGGVKGLTAVAALISAVLVLPKTAVDTLGSIEANRIATQRAKIDLVSAQLDLIDKAYRLHREGKISTDALEQQQQMIARHRVSMPQVSEAVREAPKVLDREVMRSQVLRKLLERALAAGVHDPDLNLFLAIVSNDLELARRALDAGADVNVTDRKIINKIRAQVRDDVMLEQLMQQYELWE